MTEEERLELIPWVKSLIPGLEVNSGNQSVYVVSPEDKSIPALFWEIKKRIIEKEGLESIEPVDKNILDRHFKDYVAIIHNKGIINKHRDDNRKGLYHSRFNAYIQLPDKGGETYYNGKLVQTKEGCYVFCRSGIDYHWCEPIESEKERFSFSYCFLLRLEEVDHIESKRPLGGKMKPWSKTSTQ